jgi:hypothetical protein
MRLRSHRPRGGDVEHLDQRGQQKHARGLRVGRLCYALLPDFLLDAIGGREMRIRSFEVRQRPVRPVESTSVSRLSQAAARAAVSTISRPVPAAAMLIRPSLSADTPF